MSKGESHDCRVSGLLEQGMEPTAYSVRCASAFGRGSYLALGLTIRQGASERRPSMHHAMKDLPILEDYGDGFCSRFAEWGGMIVSYETFPKGVDATPLFKGLPDDMCQSPHWGYL